MSYLATPDGRAVIAALCGKGDLAAALESTLKMEQGFWMTAAADIIKLLCSDQAGASVVVTLLTAHLGNEILEALDGASSFAGRRLSAQTLEQIKAQILGIKNETLR